MHGFAVFGQGAFDGVSDQKRSRAERLVPGIESGEVTIGAPPVREGVNRAGDIFRHIKHVQPQHIALEKRACGIEVELFEQCLARDLRRDHRIE